MSFNANQPFVVKSPINASINVDVNGNIVGIDTTGGSATMWRRIPTSHALIVTPTSLMLADTAAFFQDVSDQQLYYSNGAALVAVSSGGSGASLGSAAPQALAASASAGTALAASHEDHVHALPATFGPSLRGLVPAAAASPSATKFLTETATFAVPAGPANTDAVPEGSSNMYHTAARVRGVALTGVDTATTGAVSASDSILGGVGKLEATKATKASPVFSGPLTIPGPEIRTSSAISATTIDTTKGYSFKQIAANTTFTFNSAPATDTLFIVEIQNTDASNARSIGFPSSFSFTTQLARTVCYLPPSGRVRMTFRYDGSAYEVSGDLPPRNNLAASASPAVTDDNTKGYDIGSLWIDTVGKNFYVLADAATGAAVWKGASGGSGVPNGGTVLQALLKNSSTDGDASWGTVSIPGTFNSVAVTASRDIATTDIGKVLEINSAGVVALTLPTASAMSLGGQQNVFAMRQIGVGIPTFAAKTGSTTILNPDNLTFAQGRMLMCVQIGSTDTWTIG